VGSAQEHQQRIPEEQKTSIEFQNDGVDEWINYIEEADRILKPEERKTISVQYSNSDNSLNGTLEIDLQPKTENFNEKIISDTETRLNIKLSRIPYNLYGVKSASQMNTLQVKYKNDPNSSITFTWETP